MRNFAVIADSTCDLRKDTREELNIDYVKMNIVVDGVEKKADLDWVEYSPKELYDWMRNKKKVKTTQVPVEEFTKVFESHLQNGEDILYISCSGALSGSINMASIAVDELKTKYPEAKFALIDPKNSCLGQGMMVIEAAQMRKAGKTIEEVETYLNENKLKYNQYCVPESLEWLKIAGRVKASSAFFGNIFGVKPVLISNKNGENEAIEKVKGRKASLNRIVELAKEQIGDATGKTVYIAHSDCEEDAKYVIEKVKAEINPADIYLSVLGPIIGASVGPGTIAIYVYGKEKVK